MALPSRSADLLNIDARFTYGVLRLMAAITSGFEMRAAVPEIILIEGCSYTGRVLHCGRSAGMTDSAFAEFLTGLMAMTTETIRVLGKGRLSAPAVEFMAGIATDLFPFSGHLLRIHVGFMREAFHPALQSEFEESGRVIYQHALQDIALAAYNLTICGLVATGAQRLVLQRLGRGLAETLLVMAYIARIVIRRPGILAGLLDLRVRCSLSVSLMACGAVFDLCIRPDTVLFAAVIERGGLRDKRRFDSRYRPAGRGRRIRIGIGVFVPRSIAVEILLSALAGDPAHKQEYSYPKNYLL